ncbi:hypothetical protein V493_01587 [Pseudogymnoascus sp. VKM F-4281 (FW-2241)]|nr:hypothetical protein V493_01587 [Pseudogymnoascus sp. VKM F-4281 (FW-2241)]
MAEYLRGVAGRAERAARVRSVADGVLLAKSALEDTFATPTSVRTMLTVRISKQRPSKTLTATTSKDPILPCPGKKPPSGPFLQAGKKEKKITKMNNTATLAWERGAATPWFLTLIYIFLKSHWTGGISGEILALCMYVHSP